MLRGAGSVEVGQIGVLGHGDQSRGGVRHHRGAAQSSAPVGQQIDLVRHGDVSRVHVVGAGPHDLAVGRLGGQLDITTPGAARELRHLEGRAHQAGCLIRAHVDRGGETDGAVGDDPHAHAEVGVVVGRLAAGIVKADRLGTDPLHPQLGRLAPRGRARARPR